MSKPRKVKVLEELATVVIGDGKAPHLFFVTDQGVVDTVSRDFATAYQRWLALAAVRPMVECALEGRQYGVMASVEPESDEPGARLRYHDDTHTLRRLA
jgi:hypothetical protein